jgi:hypothetical protein
MEHLIYQSKEDKEFYFSFKKFYFGFLEVV